MDHVLTALRAVLGFKVGIGISDPQAEPVGLWPEEAASMTRAVPKRHREFAAGRRAARAAMAELGLTPAAILQGSDRAPVWPSPIVGSIAHSDTCCIAIVAHSDDDRTVGIDVERATPLDADLIDVICTPPEREWVARQSDPGLAAKQVFSAKEAVYKAQYPLTGQVIGFDAVTLDLHDGQFTATTHPQLKGAILIHDGLILSVAHG